MNSGEYFCVYCGKGLDQNAPYCHSCGAGFEDRFINCASCGSRIVAGDKFCTICSAEIVSGQHVPGEMAKSQRSQDEIIESFMKEVKKAASDDNFHKPPIQLNSDYLNKPPNLSSADLNHGPRINDYSIPAEIWDVLRSPGYTKPTSSTGGRKYWVAAIIVFLLGLAGLAAFLLLT